MRSQRRFFTHPFRKTFRSSRPPRLDRWKKKRRKAIQTFRRQQTEGIQKATLEKVALRDEDRLEGSGPDLPGLV